LRARINPKLALRLREARRPPTEQQVRDIAAALDAAAVAIERSWSAFSSEGLPRT
jgi:hypothetical protein